MPSLWRLASDVEGETVSVSFVVYGKPQPAGSKRAFTRGARTMVVDANAKSRPWKQEVTGSAVRAMLEQVEGPNHKPLEGPLEVTLTFYVERPKGHYGKKGLRPTAPPTPTTRPDVLKLARAVEDAMTGVVYRDDAQIVWELLEKRYGSPARVEVRVGVAARYLEGTAA